MARIAVKLWLHPPYRGKLVVIPTTDEERAALRALREHVGNRQQGSRFDIIFPWRDDDAVGRKRHCDA